jgi:GNAT superfamily N-acetyltransferase
MGSRMEAPNARSSVTLRPASAGDEAFLRQVYGSTRSEEMAMVSWSEDEKGAFLRMQFDAQAHYYRAHFEHARFDVIDVGGEPAGRLYVDRRADEIRVIDIALLPEYRGQGIGGTLLRELLDEANRSRSRVTIHVEQFNPARRLYERLGFAPMGVNGIHLLMQWTPALATRLSDMLGEPTAYS